MIAKDIINYIGNKANIIRVTNCATRLRFILKDDSLVQEVALKDMEIVAGILRRGDQFQIVIGMEAANLCNDINQLLKIDSAS